MNIKVTLTLIVPNLLGLLASVFALLIFASCSSKEEEMQKRIEVTKIVENRSAQELLNDLYIGSDGDMQSLCRMLNTTPSVVDRIRNGKTEATTKFEERIKEVAIYYSVNGQSFSKLQSVLDSEYGWYDSILNFPSHHPWWFWGINIIILLVLAFVWIVAIWPILVEMLIFLIAWIASLICVPSDMPDKYTNTINPVMEQVI